MSIENHRLWRALLQLGQITEAVFELEIPQQEGLSQNDLTTLRLLRWHGPKTLNVIAQFLMVTHIESTLITEELIQKGYIKQLEVPSGSNKFIVGLTPSGPPIVKKIVEQQQQFVVNALKHLEPELRVKVLDILENLTQGLVAESQEFGISCASCWAHEPSECLLPKTSEHCAFLQLHRADLDPDPSEGVDDCPPVCTLHSITRIEMHKQPVQIGVSNE